MGSEEKHQRPTVISRSRSSESSVGRAIQASHGPGLNSAKHPLISVYKVGKVFIAAIAFDRGFSIIGDFLLPLQLLRELIKFSFYFLCQGVTSKDDDDDCRTCSQNQNPTEMNLSRTRTL